ncbi:sterol desaturase family protein [Haliea atlantica]
MRELLQDDLSLFALPLYLAAVALEAWYSARHRLDRYRLSDSLTSFGMLALAGLAELLPRLLALAAFVYLHEVSPLRDVVERQWWAWLLLILLDDFTYYWFHRANHEVRLLWAGHVNHHSSRYLNFATALRQGVGERVPKFLFWLWLPLLGFDPAMIITVISINLFYQFWIHTQSVGRLHPWIEAVFNTPCHHRVHHGSNVRYLDRNHGGMLIVWDRLFGTFAPETDEEPVRYGLTRNLDNDGIWNVLTHEYRALARDLRRAPDWRARLRYLFDAPGWQHDGPDRRSKTLRADVADPQARSPGEAP